MDLLPEEVNTDKFEIDDGTVNYGIEYQEKCVALFTLKLLRQTTVEKFWLTSNMIGMSPFDDLFICTIENNLKNIYLVQIKHNRKQKPLRDDDFTKKNSKLHLKKFSGYQKLLDANSHRYPKEFQPADHVRIIIFTNRPVDPLTNTTLERLIPDTNHFLSTSQEIYTGKPETISEQKLDMDFASKFLVYASQFDLDDPNDIPDKFQTYINNWLKIETKKLALTKPHALRLYHFATLHKYLQWPNIGPCEHPWGLHIWSHLKTNFGIATLEFAQTMIQNEWKPIIQNDYNDFFSRVLFGTPIETLTLNQLIELKGVVGMSPLIIIMNGNIDIQDASNVFTMVGVKGDADVTKYETLRKISDDLRDVVLSTKISLQGRQVVVLRDVIDRTDEFTIVALLDALKTGGIGRAIVTDEEFHISRKLNKIFVGANAIKTNLMDMFIIKLNGTKDDFMQASEKTCDEVVARNELITYASKYILVNEYTDINPDQFKNLNVHYIQTNNLETYEWNGTIGSINGIKADIFYKPETIELENMSSYFHSRILIISGVPGIGKTVCTKEIATNITSQRWVVLVNLKDEVLYFKELLRRKKITPEQHLQHFFKETHCELSTYIFTRKLRAKNITIIFDGFDEIAPKFTKVVAGMIKLITDAGYKTVVTTRTVLQKRVEQEFATTSLSLVPFDDDDIKCYITARCGDDSFRRWLFQITQGNMSEFCTNPLHLKLVVDHATEEFRKNDNMIGSDLKINLLQLYRKYIEMKLALFSSKIGLINIDERDIEKYHKNFAVDTLFANQPEYGFIQTRMKVKLEDYEEKLDNGAEKTGLLVADYKEGVFIHRTVAEYYTALWFLDHSNKPEVEIKAAMHLLKLVLVKPEYSVVRVFMELQCETSDFNREELINIILSHEVDFNECLTEGSGNALHVVAFNDQPNLADILITCGCDITKKNYEHECPLHLASLGGSINIAQLLLSEGADVNCTDFRGKTPLHYATSQSFEICNFLLNVPKIEVNKPSVHGDTPLHEATTMHIPNIVEALLAHGADMNSSNMDGMTPLHYIITEVLPSSSEMLIAQQVDLRVLNHDNVRNEQVKSIWRRIEVAKFMLDAQPDSSKRSISGDNIVSIAALNCLPHMLKMVLAIEGIDVNVQNREGITPLHIASEKGRFRNVRLLIASKADVNKQDNEGNTPLHLVMYKMPPTANGVNDTKPWQIGVSIMVDFSKCIQALLVNGADWSLRNNQDRTPYDIAKDSRNEHVFEMLNRAIDYNDDY